MRLAISLTVRASSVSRARLSGGTVDSPILSCRAGTIETRLALPHRSPYPLIVPWTWRQPASTAASAFATASSPSLWLWMPSGVRSSRRTSAVTSATQWGRLPPLVSHSTTQSAPDWAAADKDNQHPAKLDCAAAALADDGPALAMSVTSAQITQQRLPGRTWRTWRVQDFPKSDTAGVSAAASARRLPSSSTRTPALRVAPKATSFARRSASDRARRKNSASLGFEPGQPPST